MSYRTTVPLDTVVTAADVSPLCAIAENSQSASVTTAPASLDSVLASLPRRYAGPGGAVAVLRAGEVLVRHAWGWANAERRIPFTPRSLFRMCSITKQFTCAAMLDLFPDPTILDADVATRLPRLLATPPGALHLASNQSGLRDYWAVAMLHGSPAEAPFGDAEAERVIGGTRSLQFAPGTRYAYTNQNFRILSDVLEDRTGRSFADLLRTRVFAQAGMETALLAADTSAMPDGTVGYEGSQAAGFRAAANHILWTGDAGLGASLDDMIAWERWIDATSEDPGGLYQRMSAPVSFAGGAPAPYGFGLARSIEFGHAATGHGGALRGWRSHRIHVAGERLSVVAMFNHMGDARQAALDLLGAALGEPSPPQAADLPAPDWLGCYLDPETGLVVRVDTATPGRVRLWFGHGPELLDLQPDGSAAAAHGTRLSRDGAALRMDRPQENMSSRLVATAERTDAGSTAPTGLAGRYRCEELDAEITVADAGGALYGAFSGFLGAGRMELAGRDRGQRLGAPLPARARPYATWGLDPRIPAGRNTGRGGLLAGPPAGLRSAAIKPWRIGAHALI